MTELKHLDSIPLVYFIQAGDGGLIKIGYTENIDKRYTALCRANPYALTLLGVIENRDTDLERTLHRRFAAIRSHAAWFHPTQELRAFIAAHTTDVYVDDLPDDDAEDPDATLLDALTDVDALLSECETAPTPLLTIDQLACKLRVSPSIIVRCVRAGTLPCLRIGRRIRFHAPALLKYLSDVSTTADAIARDGVDPFTLVAANGKTDVPRAS